MVQAGPLSVIADANHVAGGKMVEAGPMPVAAEVNHPAAVGEEDALALALSSSGEDLAALVSAGEDIAIFSSAGEDVAMFSSPGEDVAALTSPGEDAAAFLSPGEGEYRTTNANGDGPFFIHYGSVSPQDRGAVQGKTGGKREPYAVFANHRRYIWESRRRPRTRRHVCQTSTVWKALTSYP